MFHSSTILPALCMVFSLVILSGCQSTGADGKPLTAQEIAQKREATLEISKVGLAALIKQNPGIRRDIETAPGYAGFNTANVNVVLLVLARGEGIGAGYQDQYQIILFKNTDAIDQFLLTSIDGQRGGMDVDANFSAGFGGTIRSFNPDITIYTVGLKG